MDIVDLLHREIWKESVAHAPRVPGSVEAMKLAVEEIMRLRISKPTQDLDQTQTSQIQQSTR